MAVSDYIDIIWEGAPASFRRSFCGHTFTDEEAEVLASGGCVTVRGLTSKAGKTFDARLSLEMRDYNGRDYLSVSPEFIHGIPNEWCGHFFTDEEKKDLENGDEVYLDDCVSKKTGRAFNCSVRWGVEDGRERIIPAFK